MWLKISVLTNTIFWKGTWPKLPSVIVKNITSFEQLSNNLITNITNIERITYDNSIRDVGEMIHARRAASAAVGGVSRPFLASVMMYNIHRIELFVNYSTTLSVFLRHCDKSFSEIDAAFTYVYRIFVCMILFLLKVS